MRIIFTILLTLSLPTGAHAQPADRTGEDLVQTELVPSVPRISPGETFLLGIRFRIEPGWHIYWKNPGDSGQAPEVKWTAPAGFEFSPLQFPVPTKFEEAGGIVGYGYGDEVMLLARVSAPPSAKPGETARISGELFWLVCEDVCLPGKRTVTLELPITSTPASSVDPTVGRWTARLPEPAEDSTGVARVDAAVLKLADTSVGQKFIVEWRDTPNSVEWFPAASDQFSISDIRIDTRDKTTTVTFTATPFAKTKVTPATLDSVLAYTVNGQRKGLAIPVRVIGASGASSETLKSNR